MRIYFIIILMLVVLQGFCQMSTTQEDSYTVMDLDNNVNETRKKRSNGDWLETYFIYPKEMSHIISCSTTLGGSLGILNLISKNIINIPIITYEVLVKPSGEKYVVAGDAYTYYPNTPYKMAHYKVETQAPIPYSSFGAYYYSLTSCDFIFDPTLILQETYDSYDNYGNLLQKTEKGGRKITYFYGYNSTYKITEVVNSSKVNCAYTSFETNEQGNWNYDNTFIQTGVGPTPMGGISYYQIGTTNAITSNILPAPMDLIISFWAYGTTSPPFYTVSAYTMGSTTSIPAAVSLIHTGPTINSWTYVEYQTNASQVIISGSASGGFVDELRLYPKNAEMQTMSYTPLIGMTNSCDAASHFTYYGYDDLGRMIYIQDQNKNIIKKMEYGIKKTE